jgi:Holliday junction resolvase RusA-like endonuclease
VVWDEPKPLARPRFVRTATGVRTYTERKDQNVRFHIRKAWLELEVEPLVGALRMEVTAWLRLPKSVSKKRSFSAMPVVRPDLDNYVKQVEDALLGYAFKDDAQIVTIIARKRYAVAASPWAIDKPCWQITLDEIGEIEC